jgi:hypothetical protein
MRFIALVFGVESVPMNDIRRQLEHAVNFHGFVRVTEDTDVVWIRSAENEKYLQNLPE